MATSAVAACGGTEKPSALPRDDTVESRIPRTDDTEQRRAGEASTKDSRDGIQAPGAASASEIPNGEGSEAFPCAGLSCRRFASASQATRWLVQARTPRVVGFGEAHAPRGFEGVPTVVRFREQLLPVLAPRSSHLVIELLSPAPGCEPEREVVQKESDAVTSTQAEGNQSDYVALGHRARRAGVVPDILRVSCEDLQAIAQAGDLGISVMMETIARLSAAEATARLARSPPERPLVLLYGGALHNDVQPRDALASWSYGQELAKSTNGGYLEVDLLVPELVGDSESWKKFTWYDAYRSLDDLRSPVLIQMGKSSFALVFPRSSSSGERTSPSGDSTSPSDSEDAVRTKASESDGSPEKPATD